MLVAGLGFNPSQAFFCCPTLAATWKPRQEPVVDPQGCDITTSGCSPKPAQHIPEKNAKSSAFPCSLPVLPSPCPVAVATGARRAWPRSCGRAGWQHGVTPKVRAGAHTGGCVFSPSSPRWHQLPQRSSQIQIPCSGWEKSAPCGFEQAEPKGRPLPNIQGQERFPRRG